MFKINKSLTLLIIFNLFLTLSVKAQTKYSSATVAFYNVENIFDTIKSVGYINGNLPYNDKNYHIQIPESDISKYETEEFKQSYTYENIKGKKIIRPLILQDEFLPNGNKKWNTQKYFQKINNISKVISELGTDVTGSAPVIVGICEIETREILEDIANSSALKKYDYDVVHFNSFDARGVDTGLLYQKSRFKVIDARPHPIFNYDSDGKRRYTRDILQVTGLLDGEEITFLVNHWPSRSGGEKASMPARIEAAKVMKGIFDDLKSKNPNAKVIAMGDFNDDPISPSIKNTFNPAGEMSKVTEGGYYNPMLPLYKKGIGTLAYRDAWNLFDQFISTSSLVTKNKDYSSYKIYKTEVFNKSYLIATEGTYKGFPNRMWSGDTYRANGYSDHFPVYTILLKQAK
ncbi:endonuclease [Empedobacter brevis]|uniref:endonuclease/exonuclease/phosphatase family protein n=1 Tax=Empedobacter brevis TaxID=247 RepID=UPI0039AF80E2